MKLLKYALITGTCIGLSACILNGDPLTDEGDGSGSGGNPVDLVESDFHDFDFADFTPEQLALLFEAKQNGDTAAAANVIPNAPGTGRQITIPNGARDNDSAADIDLVESVWDNGNKQWGANQTPDGANYDQRRFVRLDDDGWSEPVNSTTEIHYRTDGNRIIETELEVTRTWGVELSTGTRPFSISLYDNFWAYWAQLQSFSNADSRQYSVLKTTDDDYYYLMQIASEINGSTQYNFVPIAEIPTGTALNYGGSFENLLVALDLNEDGTPKPTGTVAFLDPTNLSSTVGEFVTYEEETIEPSGEKIYRIVIPADDTEIRQALFLEGWKDLFFAATTQINNDDSSDLYFGIHFKQGVNKNPDGSDLKYTYLNDVAAEEIRSKFSTYCNTSNNCDN